MYFFQNHVHVLPHRGNEVAVVLMAEIIRNTVLPRKGNRLSPSAALGWTRHRRGSSEIITCFRFVQDFNFFTFTEEDTNFHRTIINTEWVRLQPLPSTRKRWIRISHTYLIPKYKLVSLRDTDECNPSSIAKHLNMNFVSVPQLICYERRQTRQRVGPKFHNNSVEPSGQSET